MSAANCTDMSDDQASNGSGRKSWVERLGRAFSNDPQDRDELKEILREACSDGVLDTEVLAMMEGALDVSETHVREAMIPRSHMVVVSLEESLEDFLPRILESGHSRFPVIGEDRDEVQGILLAKDLLRYFAADDVEFSLKDQLREAVVIPESKRLNMLLRDFRASRNHMAIVVDEYGGVSGLITIEDVLEEIVGEIDDEHDELEAAQIQPMDDDTFLVQALTEIDDFNEFFDSDLQDEDFETVGGLILAEFGRVPEIGEQVLVGDRFHFGVTASDARRVITLKLTVQEPA
jgi:magnesium and cobalt transporter